MTETSIQLAFVRSLKTIHRVAGDKEFMILEARLFGDISSDTGMILNLVHFDDVLNHLNQFLNQAIFPTLRDSLLGSYLELKRLLTPYQYKKIIVAFYQPQFDTRYLYDGQDIQIELERFMRYQDRFGTAKIGFDFESFNKLPDRERRQEYWILGQADSPSLALKGKFPTAYLWQFTDLITNEIDRLERS
jgi:hypothetical protein